jgi:hypothetical protein
MIFSINNAMKKKKKFITIANLNYNTDAYFRNCSVLSVVKFFF